MINRGDIKGEGIEIEPLRRDQWEKSIVEDRREIKDNKGRSVKMTTWGIPHR